MNESEPSGPRPAAVLVTTTFPARPGDGTPEFVLTLARSLRDFEVTVVAPRIPGSRREEAVDGVRVRRVAYFPARWEGLATDAIMPALRAQPWRVLEVPFLFLALTLGTWQEARRRRAVVLNPHWILPAGLVALVVRMLTALPYVLTVHGADAYTLRGRLLGGLKKLVVSRAAAVLPVSEDIGRTLGLEPNPAHVLRMGVDTVAIRDAVQPRQPEPGLVVGIGRLAGKKGFDVLVSALARAPGTRAEILGEGPDRGSLERLATELGVADRVCFRGRVPRGEVLSALRRAEVVAIPSQVGEGGDTDGTPVVLCEAMAAGVPVVASDLGGLGECLVDGETGVLVPPGDVATLAEVLRQVRAGAIDLETIGKAGAEEAARSLDIHEIATGYDRVLAEAATR
jgi:colanic acid/amylovoran biosynthesis glycosyltransferase